MRKNNLTRNLVLAIIIIALASYVLVSFGQAPPRAQGDTITRIGSTALKVKDLNLTVKNLRERFQQIDPDTLNSIASATIINDAIMKEAADELGIQVSDEELRDFIIRFRRGFSGEGEFINKEQWAEWVRFNYRMPVGAFETYVRENDLTLSQFRNMFSHAAFVSEAEIKEAFVEQNQSVDIDYLQLNTNMFRNEVDLSDERIKSFFEEQAESFKTESLRKIQYVFFANEDYQETAVVPEEEIQAFYDERKDNPPYHIKERVHAKHILIKPKDGDSAAAMKKITDIKKEIDGGLAFEEAAKKYSEDEANAARGGDLGLATADRWDPKFSEVAFSIEPEMVSDPVETSFGVHLIKVVEKRPEERKAFEDVKEQITKQLQNRKARELAREQAQSFQEKLEVSLDLEALATEFSVEVNSSEFFDQDPQAEIDDKIRRNANLARQVFALQNLNDFTGNIDIGRGVVIAKWTEEAEPRPLDWEADQARIKNMASAKLAEAYLEQMVQDLNKKAEASEDGDFGSMVKDYSFVKSIDVKKLDGVSALNPPNALGVADLTFDELYEASTRTVLGPYPGRYNRQFVLVFVKNKVEPNFDDFEQEKAAIQKRLKQTKGFDLMANYLFTKRQTLDPNGEKLALVQAILSNN